MGEMADYYYERMYDPQQEDWEDFVQDPFSSSLVPRTYTTKRPALITTGMRVRVSLPLWLCPKIGWKHRTVGFVMAVTEKAACVIRDDQDEGKWVPFSAACVKVLDKPLK